MKRYAYKAGEPDTGSTKKWYADARAEIFLLRRNNPPITALPVGDHEVVRTGCRLVPENAPDIKAVAEAVRKAALGEMSWT